MEIFHGGVAEQNFDFDCNVTTMSIRDVGGCCIITPADNALPNTAIYNNLVAIHPNSATYDADLSSDVSARFTTVINSSEPAYRSLFAPIHPLPNAYMIVSTI